MKLISYGPHYHDVWFPAGRYFKFGRRIQQMTSDGGGVITRRLWRFDLMGFLFDPFDGFLRKNGWSSSFYPSYWTEFSQLFDNILTFLTPWYRQRRNLLANLYNRNDSKLLWEDRKSCRFRSRTASVHYFDVRFGFIFGTMTTSQYFDSTDKPKNLLCHRLTEDTELVQATTIIIRRMPILTARQCQRFLETAADRTCFWLNWDTSTEESHA